MKRPPNFISCWSCFNMVA